MLGPYPEAVTPRTPGSRWRGGSAAEDLDGPVGAVGVDHEGDADGGVVLADDVVVVTGAVPPALVDVARRGAVGHVLADVAVAVGHHLAQVGVVAQLAAGGELAGPVERRGVQVGVGP